MHKSTQHNLNISSLALGFTLDWFFNDTEPKLGMFHDRRLLRGLYYSFVIALMVSALSVAVGTTNAFLFVRRDFRFKNFFYILMIVPLVIPGVILGISILVMASNIANGLEDNYDIELEFLRPGLLLVVLVMMLRGAQSCEVGTVLVARGTRDAHE